MRLPYFLFGFAFAFHDLEYRKIYEKPALLVENLASDEEVEKELEKKNEEETKKKTTPTPNPTLPPTPMQSNDALNPKPTPTPDEFNSEPFCFYFESDRANLIPMKKEAAYFNNTNDDAKLEFMRLNENYESLENLAIQINENKSKGVIRLTLIGSADDNPISVDGKKTDKTKNNIKANVYPSNYDLSEARIQTTRNEISKKLYKQNNKEWQRIDWITVAHSNEEYTNQSKDSNIPTKKCMDIIYDKVSGKRIQNKIDVTNPTIEDLNSGKRSVAVHLSMVSREPSAETQKLPNLMDYMYFSIYTITTTGYGDIKPMTRYAKFLVSLENFFEVFFLVCFMNTLIALKSEPKIPSKS